MKYSQLKQSIRLLIYAQRRKDEYRNISDETCDNMYIYRKDFTQSEWGRIVSVVVESVARTSAEAEEAVSALGLDMDEQLDEYY